MRVVARHFLSRFLYLFGCFAGFVAPPRSFFSFLFFMSRRAGNSALDRTAPAEERILLFVPEESRAENIQAVLEGIDVQAEAFTTLSPLNGALQEGAGAIIVDERAITTRAVRLLSTAMAQREPWSNLPILILTSGEAEAIQRLNRLSLFGPATASNVAILERPVHEVTLTTVVRSALRARRRQYEVRDLMQNLEATNEQLRESQAALQAVNETLEERVEARTEQVRQLALDLSTAEQRERTRVAQVLHDHLQQLLHGARIWANSLSDHFDGEPPDALSRVHSLLDEATEATRSLSVELSPPMHEEEGFVDALDWLSVHVARTHNLKLKLDVPSDLRIDEGDLQTLVFRCVRELVFNVVKHAEVGTAALRACHAGDHVVIEVVDAGKGFDPDSLRSESDPEPHFGLVSVRKRLNLVGGQLTLDAASGEGTRARIEVPLPE